MDFLLSEVICVVIWKGRCENGIAAKFEDMFWMTYFKLYKHEEGPNWKYIFINRIGDDFMVSFSTLMY